MADLDEKALDDFIEHMRLEICKVCGIPKEFLEAPIPHISDDKFIEEVTAITTLTPTEILMDLDEDREERDEDRK